MNNKKILESEISDIKVSSLPSRPTAPTSFGGRGYTSKQMKEAFDKLPLFIIEKFNSLIDDINSLGDNSIAAMIPTGLADNHTLADLFTDITSGALSDILMVGDNPISQYSTILDELLDKVYNALSSFPGTYITSLSYIMMSHGCMTRTSATEHIEMDVPPAVDDGYFSELTFDSGADGCEFTTYADIRFSGDDVADERFYPKENTHYTIFLWYDGNIQGVIRGIPNA